MPLIDVAIRQAKATGKDYTLGDYDGLSLGISAKGKWWLFRYSWLGQRKRMSLGTYPEVSLREARALLATASIRTSIASRSASPPNSPHCSPAVVFAQAVGKSRRWISYEVQERKLLALTMGNLGYRIPDWHIDPLKHKLIQAVLKFARERDPWDVHDVLSRPHEMLDGRAPIEAVTFANFHEAVMAACFALKENDEPSRHSA